MKVYICINNGVIEPESYTTLIDACNSFGLSYDKAMRGTTDFGAKKLHRINVNKGVRKGLEKNFEKHIQAKVNKNIEAIANGTNKPEQYESKFAEYERDKDEYREA